MHLLLPLLFLIYGLGLQGTPESEPTASAKSAPVVLPLARGVLSRYIAAIGGRVAIWNLDSFTASAQITIEEADSKGQLDLAFRKSNLMRIKVDLGLLGTSEVGSDGEVAWEIITTKDGQHFEELISLKEAQQRRRSLNWFELAIRLNANAKSLQTIGPADFEEHPCWELQKISHNGSEERIFIDRNSYLLRGIRMIESSLAGNYEVTISFRKWIPVEPLFLFHELVISSQDTEIRMTFDSISLDNASPDLFQPPKEIMDLIEEENPSKPAAVEKSTTDPKAQP